MTMVRFSYINKRGLPHCYAYYRISEIDFKNSMSTESILNHTTLTWNLSDYSI
jgi:hypothetical protein